jgi:hypothetical protein
MTSPADIQHRLRPRHVVDAIVGEAACKLRAEGHDHYAQLLNAWLVENNALKTEAADTIAQLVKERDAALSYATNLLVSFVEQHCDPVPEWKPLPTLMGVLTQLDNASTVVREFKARAEVAEAEAATLREALEREREECAKLADEQAAREEYGHAKHACVMIAQALRARTQQHGAKE